MENNILKEALANILKKATVGIEKGVDFLNAEIPEVAEQILKWHMWESILINSIFLIIAVLVYIFAYTLYKIGVDRNKVVKDGVISHGADWYLASFAFIIVASIILLSVILNLTWLKILIAPKLYLIEYAAELLK